MQYIFGEQWARSPRGTDIYAVIDIGCHDQLFLAITARNLVPEIFNDSRHNTIQRADASATKLAVYKEIFTRDLPRLDSRPSVLQYEPTNWLVT